MACDKCTACCRLFLVNLTEEEYRSRRYRTMFSEFVEDFALAEEMLANNVERKDDGSCIYLLEDGRCEIYEDRPQVCRDFSCERTDGAFPNMADEVRRWRGRRRLPHDGVTPHP